MRIINLSFMSSSATTRIGQSPVSVWLRVGIEEYVCVCVRFMGTTYKWIWIEYKRIKIIYNPIRKCIANFKNVLVKHEKILNEKIVFLYESVWVWVYTSAFCVRLKRKIWNRRTIIKTSLPFMINSFIKWICISS